MKITPVIAAVALTATAMVGAVAIAEHRTGEAIERERARNAAVGSIAGHLVNSCAFGVGWACGLDVEVPEDEGADPRGRHVAVHVTDRPGMWGPHVPPTGPDFGYSDVAREVLRTSPVGTSTVVVVDADGKVIGHSGAYGTTL